MSETHHSKAKCNNLSLLVGMRRPEGVVGTSWQQELASLKSARLLPQGCQYMNDRTIWLKTNTTLSLRPDLLLLFCSSVTCSTCTWA